MSKVTPELEAMARAIGEVYDGHVDPVETPNRWGAALDAARAALLAIRDPGAQAAMIGAVEFAVTSNPRRVWRYMTDYIRTGQINRLEE